ncbi:MAG: PDZ domain-containing protein, partial [Planctomycetaceae bacterium]
TPGFERVVKELSAGYEVEYGFLGIRPADATIEDFDGLTPAERPSGGAVALSVTANAPAARGKVVAGDVVVEVDGVALRDSGDLMREIALIGPKNTTNIKVWRPSDQTFVSLKVSLGKWPVRNDDDVIATAYRLPDWRGIRVDYSTARSKYLRAGGVIEFEPGVLVVSVDEQRHGLKIQAGDFIGRVGDKRIRTPAEFNAAVIELGNRSATLHTTDGRTIEIEP